MGRVEIYPCCAIGDTGQRYPDWLRGLDGRSGGRTTTSTAGAHHHEATTTT